MQAYPEGELLFCPTLFVFSPLITVCLPPDPTRIPVRNQISFWWQKLLLHCVEDIAETVPEPLGSLVVVPAERLSQFPSTLWGIQLYINFYQRQGLILAISSFLSGEKYPTVVSRLSKEIALASLSLEKDLIPIPRKKQLVGHLLMLLAQSSSCWELQPYSLLQVSSSQSSTSDIDDLSFVPGKCHPPTSVSVLSPWRRDRKMTSSLTYLVTFCWRVCIVFVCLVGSIFLWHQSPNPSDILHENGVCGFPWAVFILLTSFAEGGLYSIPHQLRPRSIPPMPT